MEEMVHERDGGELVVHLKTNEYCSMAVEEVDHSCTENCVWEDYWVKEHWVEIYCILCKKEWRLP